MSDTPAETRAAKQGMRLADIVATLFVLVTAGCAGVEHASRGEPPRTGAAPGGENRLKQTEAIGAVLAQTIYKQIDANGRTTYTDRPPAGMAVPDAPFAVQEPGSAPPPRIAHSTQADLANALRTNSAMTSMDAATVDFNEAARRLRQARQSRLEGVEPRPGERGDSAGAGAMNQRYRRRQQKLEREVVAAEKRSHETALIRSTLMKRQAKIDPPEPTLP